MDEKKPMTNWEQLEQSICDYVDGLLSAEARKEVEQRLDQDADAKELYTQLKALRNGLRSLPAIKTSPDFDTVLRTRIQMEKSFSRGGFLSGNVRIPAFVAVGAVVVVAVLLWGTISGPGSFQNRLNSTQFTGAPVQSAGTNIPVSSIGATHAVKYPIDVLRMARRGTLIDSRSQRRNQEASRLDSLRMASPERPITTVEF